uniref:Uncharacterized protein n=1 Tax=Parascaris univalens TaxID=6257 RepID=A0A915CKX8_PARUN
MSTYPKKRNFPSFEKRSLKTLLLFSEMGKTRLWCDLSKEVAFMVPEKCSKRDAARRWNSAWRHLMVI